MADEADTSWFHGDGGEQVTGSVSLDEPYLNLPTGSVLTVTLQDISLADAPAPVIGIQTYTTGGRQAPLPFSVSYDPNVIMENHAYSVSVRITDAGGNLTYINDTVPCDYQRCDI